MKNAEMKIIRLGENNVIATSGPDPHPSGTISGIDSDKSTLLSFKDENFDSITVDDSSILFYYKNGNTELNASYATLQSWARQMSAAPNKSKANGYYTWDNDRNAYVKQ